MWIDLKSMEEKVFQDALNAWGEESQLRIMQEELAECIVAISHYLRSKDNESKCLQAYGNLVEEMADVLITLSQFYRLWGPNINYITFQKINRLADRLAKFKEQTQTDEAEKK